MQIINNHELHVETYGPTDRPSVVLLHHGLGSTRAWKSQIQPLISHSYGVIVYDRWGYGKSAPRSELSMPYFKEDIDDLKTLLDHLKVKQTNIVGHSDGGTIGLYFAAQYPNWVNSLVTVAAHIYIEEKMIPGIEGIRSSYESENTFRKGLQLSHGNQSEEVFYNWYDGWLRPEIANWDMRPILADIECPTLVVQGSEDEHASAHHAKDIAGSIPKAELWLMPNASHMLPQEHPDEFNQRILAFLDKHNNKNE